MLIGVIKRTNETSVRRAIRVSDATESMKNSPMLAMNENNQLAEFQDLMQ